MREIRRAMKDLSDSSKVDMKSTHRAVAEIVARQAKYEVPVRTGRLRSTIRTRSTLTQGRVVAGMGRVPYAGPIHFGWPTRPDPSKRWRGGPISPQPFIYEAADRRIDEVVDAYEQRIGELIRSYRLGG
jgi:hypothetical protein